MKKSILLITMLCLAFVIFQSDSCTSNTTDTKDQSAQERLAYEGRAQAGMPDIHNFTDKKMLKMLYELRDNPNMVNYAYLWSEVSGKWIYLGKCIGYGLPYATQYSNPEKWVVDIGIDHTLPQAEPNGLFMPASAEGTWLMLVNPNNPNEIKPIYVEPRCIVSPFKLPTQ